MQRKEELEAKKAKLAELRRQRQEREQQQKEAREQVQAASHVNTTYFPGLANEASLMNI